ncbi:MAG TPA: tetratricopeptide repeat protein [Ktedonobacteraceae bacterium]
MTEIAQQLYGPRYYTDFQPLSPKAQQAMLANDLRGTNHLLILDNLESITGAHLAIQHILPKEEQAALHSFLIDLARGKTRVLLGSRSGEEWLSKGTFDDNIYDLPGLDAEAASLLADRILERNSASKYRTDEKEQENLRRLIKLLDGFPLAMEVVLANLTKQTPREILDALQAGDVKIDPHSDSQEKTASILRCIDYSHSNLSPEAQQLLLCLAPFTSVVWTEMLDRYTSHLKQQLILANLPFDRWSEVLREAQNWGLLSPHEVKGYLHMQPTLAYFLRNRLNETGQVEVRRAIETAFRGHYDELGNGLYHMLDSKEPQERQTGQVLTRLEYENLTEALNLALKNQVSIYNPYAAMFRYLESIQDWIRGLELSHKVCDGLYSYPIEKVTGTLRGDLVSVLDRVAYTQLELKQFIAAEKSYQKALATHFAIKNHDEESFKKSSAGFYFQLGRVAQEQRQWVRAEDYYQQALPIFIEYNDHNKQAITYYQLGRIAQEQHQWVQAEAYYQQALKIHTILGDSYAIAKTYNQLGKVAQEQRQWVQANAYYQQALRTKIENNDYYSQAPTYNNLGTLAMDQHQWQEAEEYHQKALRIYIEYNDRHNQAKTYNHLGLLAQIQQQFQQASQYLLQALQIFIEYDDKYAVAIVLGGLAGLWNSNNDVNMRTSIANGLGMSLDEMEKLLCEALEEQTADEEKKE